MLNTTKRRRWLEGMLSAITAEPETMVKTVEALEREAVAKAQAERAATEAAQRRAEEAKAQAERAATEAAQGRAEEAAQAERAAAEAAQRQAEEEAQAGRAAAEASRERPITFEEVVRRARIWRNQDAPGAFRVLGLDMETASLAQVNSAFRQCARLLHPDKCKDLRGRDVFQIIQTAAELARDAMAQPKKGKGKRRRGNV